MQVEFTFAGTIFIVRACDDGELVYRDQADRDDLWNVVETTLKNRHVNPTFRRLLRQASEAVLTFQRLSREASDLRAESASR